MRKVEVRFEETDLAALDRQAQEGGVTRSELIRHRTLATAMGKKFTPQDFSALVSDAYTRNHGSINRRQVESIVAFVFNRMAANGPSGVEASPSLPST